MADRSGGCQEVKKDQITQAEKMLAYLKSRLPADKADQAFKELAEKGIFNRTLLASAGSVAGLGASLVVTVETLSGIALAPEIAMVALIVGGAYITYEVATYLIDKVRSTSGETAARDAEDTLYRKGNVSDRDRFNRIPVSVPKSSAAGGNPDPDDKCQKKVPKSGSGKEKADDVPSRFKGERPYIWESGADFAKRLLDAEGGDGNYKDYPGSDFAKLKKWGNRGFELPRCSKKSKK